MYSKQFSSKSVQDDEPLIDAFISKWIDAPADQVYRAQRPGL
jgi:hypothetical protein